MDDAEDLIERLLAAAGMMLEDASALALLYGGRSRSERLAKIQAANADVAALLGAAKVIERSLRSVGECDAEG